MDKVKFERKGVQIIVKSGLRKRDWEKWSGSIGQISRLPFVRINIEEMIARATRASLNLTVRVFKCSSVSPFPSILSLSLSLSLPFLYPSRSLLEALSDCESGRAPPPARFNGCNVPWIKMVCARNI